MAVICVDFDGTCVKHEYPLIGDDVPGAVDVLKRLQHTGHSLILWTMRHDEELRNAVQWFINRGITLYGVNKNPGQSDWTNSPKAYAHAYIDDAAVGCPLAMDDPDVPNRCDRPYVDWEEIEIYFEINGYLPKTPDRYINDIIV